MYHSLTTSLLGCRRCPPRLLIVDFAGQVPDMTDILDVTTCMQVALVLFTKALHGNGEVTQFLYMSLISTEKLDKLELMRCAFIPQT